MLKAGHMMDDAVYRTPTWTEKTEAMKAAMQEPTVYMAFNEIDDAVAALAPETYGVMVRSRCISRKEGWNLTPIPVSPDVLDRFR